MSKVYEGGPFLTSTSITDLEQGRLDTDNSTRIRYCGDFHKNNESDKVSWIYGSIG